eukprot:934160-Amphidinium_carterae.6
MLSILVRLSGASCLESSGRDEVVVLFCGDHEESCGSRIRVLDWVEGMCRSKTFMQHLRHELEQKSKGCGCTGAHFWCKMEGWFGDADEPSDALDLASLETDGSDIEGLEVFEAFSQMVPPSYNREPMLMWATVASTCTQAEAIIAATALRRLRPALGGDHYKCGCAIMLMLARCGIPESHPAIMESVVNKLDLFLEQAIKVKNSEPDLLKGLLGWGKAYLTESVSNDYTIYE